VAPFIRLGHEVQVPLRDPPQAGVPAGREPAQEVERGRRLVVRLDEAPRVGHARGGRRFGAVDDVPAVGGQLAPVRLRLHVGRPRLGKLARHAPDLDDGDAAAKHEHDRHLEDDAERVPDAVGGEVAERLGAVAAWEDRGGGGERARGPAAAPGREAAVAGRQPPPRSSPNGPRPAVAGAGAADGGAAAAPPPAAAHAGQLAGASAALAAAGPTRWRPRIRRRPPGRLQRPRALQPPPSPAPPPHFHLAA